MSDVFVSICALGIIGAATVPPGHDAHNRDSGVSSSCTQTREDFEHL